jgi:hypothetical protein
VYVAEGALIPGSVNPLIIRSDLRGPRSRALGYCYGLPQSPSAPIVA